LNSDLAKQIALEKENLLVTGMVGRWHFSNRGEGEFEIGVNAMGTCTGRGVKSTAEDKANWKIEGGYLVMYWNNGVKSRLPLAQSGDTRTGDTMLAGSNSWITNIKATRVK
jgi:hypothetical protein